MSVINPAVIEPKPEIHYPTGDGKPMAETGIHVLTMLSLIGSLRQYYKSRPDVYVIGNIFLYYEEGNPAARVSPDCMVAKGVEPGERRSFKTWVERAVLSVIFEITSDETSEEDVVHKRSLYARLGVREYFLFDPLHDYLDRQLIGYRLIGDEYEPLIAATDGGVLSAELGVRLIPDGTQLALIHFKTGKRILPPELAYQELEAAAERAAARQAELAEERSKMADHVAAAEKRRAELAQRQSEEAQEQTANAKQQTEEAKLEFERESEHTRRLTLELERLRTGKRNSEQ